jgi:pimeloyl-ACP methyl ester carboxylesterase
MSRLKKALIIILSSFLILSIIPYFFPISTPKEEKVDLPFSNSFRSNIEGVDLHYRVWEPESEIRNKILMIHGFGGSTFSWNKTVEALVDENYLVIALDLPGFGYSERKFGFNHSQESRSKIVSSLLSKVDRELDSSSSHVKWTLLGHSMGGGTALATAVYYPEKVENLALVSPSAFSQNSKALNILIKYPPFSRALKAFIHINTMNPEQIESLLTRVYGRDPSEYEVKGYLNPLRQPDTPATLVDMIKTSSSLNEEELRQVKVPVLAIWPIRDEIVPVSEAKRLKESIYGMKISTIDSQSHLPMETEPSEFNRILIDFLLEKN